MTPLLCTERCRVGEALAAVHDEPGGHIIRDLLRVLEKHGMATRPLSDEEDGGGRRLSFAHLTTHGARCAFLARVEALHAAEGGGDAGLRVVKRALSLPTDMARRDMACALFGIFLQDHPALLLYLPRLYDVGSFSGQYTQLVSSLFLARSLPADQMLMPALLHAIPHNDAGRAEAAAEATQACVRTLRGL